MDLRVIGCHGGESAKHKPSAFLVDTTLTFDAGSLTSGLALDEQHRLEACLISHAHLDHVRDLGTLADNRCQTGAPPLRIVGLRETIQVLKDHFFNDLLWPDFSKIPAGGGPTIEYVELAPGKPLTVAGYEVEATRVNHTIDCCGYIIKRDGVALAYSGDTGPTDELWKRLNATPELRGLLLEVSFPNREQQVATISAHHTPQTLEADLAKLNLREKLPVLLYHMKPVFLQEVERECAKIQGVNLDVLALNDQFQFVR